MGKPDIFDDILDCMRRDAASYPGIFVEKEALDELFADMPAVRKYQPVPKKNPAPQIVESAASPAPAKLEKSKAPAAAPIPSGKRIEEMDLEELRNAVAHCSKCGLHSTRLNTVFSDGDSKARLMFIGEGPGRDEDEQGLPFVGKAGQLLTKMIQAMQFTREEVYIANIVKCRPPDNRVPLPDEAEACMPYLRRQIELVKPEVIVLLGATPLLWLMNMKGISAVRGKWLDYNGSAVMATYHPAYLLRNPPAKKDVWVDLQIVMKRFGKVYPGKTQAGS